jgi:hypothetical protein
MSHTYVAPSFAISMFLIDSMAKARNSPIYGFLTEDVGYQCGTTCQKRLIVDGEKIHIAQ